MGGAQGLPSYAELLEVYKLVSEAGLAGALSRFPSPDVRAQARFSYPPLRADAASLARFRAEVLAAQWQDVQRLPAYQALSNRSEYQKAWGIFQRKKKHKNARASILSDDADFRFVHAVVWSLMVFLDQSDPTRRRRLPDKRVAVAAIGHARKLLTLNLGYVRLDGQTRKSLESIIRTLAEVKGKRKATENKSYAQRRFVACLSTWFQKDFGQTFYTAARELCGLVGYSISDAALQPQSKATRRRASIEMVANALAESAQSVPHKAGRK